MRAHGLALLLCLLLALIFLNPLSLHLADRLTDDVDPLLNTWILAWDHHALVNDPLRLFQAPIFAPYADALAYSENLLGSALLTLPVALATGLPVLSHNLTLLLGFVLSGYGGYLLGRQVTRDPWAALLVGLVFTFNAYRLSMLPKVQMATLAALPLALLYLWRVVRGGRRRDALLLSFFLWLQAALSIYNGFFTALAVVALAPAFLLAQRRRIPQRLALLALAGGLALAAFLPIALPYVRVAQTLGLARTLADALPFAASLRQWLLVPPTNLVYGRLLARADVPSVGPYPVDSLFPGLVVLALAATGLVRARGRWRWAALGLALAGFVLSLGPFLQVEPLQVATAAVTLPYGWLYEYLPGFAALRAPARFAGVAMLGLALLAGLGLHALQKRGWRGPLAALLAGLVFLEALAWPAAPTVPVPQGATIPAVYRWLAGQPPGDVVELPAALPQQRQMRERWLWPQYYGLYHGHATPQGYSGFVPPRHAELTALLNRFPAPDAWRLLRGLGVRYLVLHRPYYDAEAWAAIEESVAAAGLAWAWQDDTAAVLALTAEAAAPAHVAAAAITLPGQAAPGAPYAPLLVLDVTGDAVFPPGTLARGTVTWRRDGALWHQVAFVDALPFLTAARAALLLPSDAPAAGTYDVTVRLAAPVAVEASARVAVAAIAPAVQPLPIRLTDASFRCDGEALEVRLTWQALGWVDRLQTVWLHWLAEDGGRLAQADELLSPAPVAWLPTVPVTTTHRLPIPDHDGPQRLVIGLYQWNDRFGTTIPTQFFDAGGQGVDTVTAWTSNSPICRKPS